MKIIDDETGKFYLEEGIVHCIYKRNIIIDLVTIKKAVANRIEVSEGKSRPVFISGIGVKYWTLEAKKYGFINEEAKLYISSCGIILSSTALRISVNWGMNFFPTAFPIRIFPDKEKAIAWLKKQK
ncbi:MAG TPA: hypothetical protein VNW99_11880 [Cytophagaceae bacterium]|jgi:hypothetical protein|nr:hypothetical protein [Cytophagaceae bacterium]